MSNPVKGICQLDHKFGEQYGFKPGDYGRVDGVWWIRPPRGSMGTLNDHTVTEHEDGTITVSPSILLESADGTVLWHGYLERGLWREV